MIKLTQIKPEKMTDADRFWLKRGCEGSWDKATPQEQIDGVNSGIAFMFRIEGNMKGIIVLAIGNREKKSIIVTALAGKGMMENFSEFYSEVKNLCKSVGARTLYGFVSRPGLKLTYQRKTTAVPAATLFVEDLT